MFDTIAAISSGSINQPISIIRISGQNSLEIINQMFSKKINKPNYMNYGYVVFNQEKIDEVMVCYYQGPNSFTGEDMVEIFAHGSIVNTKKILRIILSLGARIARPGEFSFQALMNNKMDLIKSQAIHDLIFSKTEEQAALSVAKFNGQTSKMIESLQKDILKIIATCETNIDYPEYDDIQVLTTENLLPNLKTIVNKIDEIISMSKISQLVFEGIKVAIVGQPNSGKSSLLNLLLNEDKAIVSNQEGTTRDIVEGQIQLEQFILDLKDTAGIRNTNDSIEQQGIQKSINAINSSDLVIHLIDGQKGFLLDDQIIEEKSQGKIYFKVFNKSDLFNKQNDRIEISVLNNDIEQLIDQIKLSLPKVDLNDERIINNVRELSLIEKTKVHLTNAIDGLNNYYTPDVVIVDLHQAWQSLGNVLGQVSEEDLLDSMFANFCLGK